jgi:hypothetical protein
MENFVNKQNGTRKQSPHFLLQGWTDPLTCSPVTIEEESSPTNGENLWITRFFLISPRVSTVNDLVYALFDTGGCIFW